MPDVSLVDGSNGAANDGVDAPRNAVAHGKNENRFNEAASSLEDDTLLSYADIIDLSRPKSLRPAMPLHDRAAQFSPFAALTGYEDAIGRAAVEVQAYIAEIDSMTRGRG